MMSLSTNEKMTCTMTSTNRKNFGSTTSEVNRFGSATFKCVLIGTAKTAVQQEIAGS